MISNTNLLISRLDLCTIYWCRERLKNTTQYSRSVPNRIYVLTRVEYIFYGADRKVTHMIHVPFRYVLQSDVLHGSVGSCSQQLAVCC